MEAQTVGPPPEPQGLMVLFLVVWSGSLSALGCALVPVVLGWVELWWGLLLF